MSKIGLLDKIKKNTSIEGADILSDSKFFENELIDTGIPAMNVALSGRIDGGFTSGLTVFAGASKHGKSILSGVLGRAYMNKYDDAIMLFYDSEFGTPKSYFESLDVDTSKVFHAPLLNVETLKFDLAKQLDMIKNEYKGARVFIFIDSIGNVASKKEAEDALKGDSKTDMSRAKDIKSLFRIVTPYLRIMDICMVAVAHVYQTQEMFSKTVVGGGTGIYYSSDNIFLMGRQQEKDGKDVVGWNLIMNVEKSRYCIEKAKFPIELRNGKGLNKFTGLLDIALKTGDVVKPSNGWYSRILDGEQEEQKWRAKDTNSNEFWQPLLNSQTFKDNVKDIYMLSNNKLINDNFILDGTEDKGLSDEVEFTT